MATSGTSTFNATCNTICAQALGLVIPGQESLPLTADQITNARFRLNAMVKRWGASPNNVHVWTTSEATLFVQPDQASYQVGPGGADHCTGSYVSTSLTVEALSGATSITVDSITGIAANDHVGITLDDGTIFWTTVSGAPAGSTINLADALTDMAAEANQIYAYTNNIVQPLRIEHARRFNIDSLFETPLAPPVMGRMDYLDLPNKQSTGTVTQLFYDRQLGIGIIYLWPTPSDVVNNHIKFTYRRPIMDFNTAADDPDLPQEWVDTLIWNLALVSAPYYDVPEQKLQRIERMAMQFLDDMKAADKEEGSIFVQPERAGRY